MVSHCEAPVKCSIDLAGRLDLLGNGNGPCGGDIDTLEVAVSHLLLTDGMPHDFVEEADLFHLGGQICLTDLDSLAE